jgi:hypothetical protein
MNYHESDEVFRVAVSHFLTRRGDQTLLARKANISVTMLNHILRAKEQGSETTRRLIAEALGFPGGAYEDFLEIGREILAGRIPAFPKLGLDDQADGGNGSGSDGGSWSGSDGGNWNGSEGGSWGGSEGGSWSGSSRSCASGFQGFVTFPHAETITVAMVGNGTYDTLTQYTQGTVSLHTSCLKRDTAWALKSYRVTDDAMQPIICQGDLILVDTIQNNPLGLKDGKMYLMCWDLHDGGCALRYLNWAERTKTVMLSCHNPAANHTMCRKLSEIHLVGQVIWSSRSYR